MEHSTLEEVQAQWTGNPVARKGEFYRYYSPKRIPHQLKQLELLAGIEGDRMAEIGPYLGFATALFMAVGFKVHAIDAAPVELLGQISPERHSAKNILDITADDLRDQDVIVCCETLEHLKFAEAEKVLDIFHESQSEWLLISVPYRCLSIDVRFIRNPFAKLFKAIFKLPSKRFTPFTPDPEPWGHKWELGYKGYPLEKLTDALKAAGFSIEKLDYVGTVQSVFLLARRTA